MQSETSDSLAKYYSIISAYMVHNVYHIEINLGKSVTSVTNLGV